MYPPPRIFVRLARLAGWNAALVLAGLALVALAGEAWLRLTAPSFGAASPSRFVPGLGVLYEPHAEVRYTNHLDFWTTQRVNSLGFLDREPPDPERAAASCHVAVVGDSFVAGREVAIASKSHVRLEALAAREAPELDVTASAFGYPGTAQANQLPYYDRHIRSLRPNLVMLVFYKDDFAGNSAVLSALYGDRDPARMPFAYPERGEDGGVRLRPPHPGYRAGAIRPGGWRETAASALAGRSLFARWLDGKRRALFPGRPDSLAGRAEALSRRPGYAWIAADWRPPPGWTGWMILSDPPPLFAEALEFTAWALAEFRRRADRDGAALAILSVHHMGGPGARESAVLRGMAEPLGIPVISQRDWIARSGGRAGDAHFPHDIHWTPQGHRWAAEAILDWLRRHPEVCDDRA